MPIQYRVLGNPGEDNALLASVDSGQRVATVLFDCGEKTLSTLGLKEIFSIEHLFFSHLHMDHVAGFDSFFRAVFSRKGDGNHIWGPPETADIIQCRFRGVMWNLHQNTRVVWYIHEFDGEMIRTYKFYLRERFAMKHFVSERPSTELLLEDPDFTVRGFMMDHKTPSIGYHLIEAPRYNINMAALDTLGLKAGSWLKNIKLKEGPQFIEIGGKTYERHWIQEQILLTKKGDDIAYLTDFLLNDDVIQVLAPKLNGCRYLVCEGQYRHSDLDLARINYHMTVSLSAKLAQKANISKLIIFHLSQRYAKWEWRDMLLEAQKIFPKTAYPEGWKIQ